LWYQGETDCWRIENIAGYAQRQKSMVENWRKRWGQGDFPFYFVQIAPYKDYHGLTDFWLEQYKAADNVKNSAMISTVDISNISEVHPKNKRDVGKRLALLALKNDYGKEYIVASGPVYKSMNIEGAKISVSFYNLGSGLTTKDGKEPDSFEVAGADGVFYPAKAAISGRKVVLSSPEVQAPVDVRFAWNNLADPNLRNKEGLPVFPFNTAEEYFD
jgi:sialate O-acetylesterase